jgi:hypothetical protein
VIAVDTWLRTAGVPVLVAGLDLNETTLPEILRDQAGYDTHAIGVFVVAVVFVSFSSTHCTSCACVAGK